MSLYDAWENRPAQLEEINQVLYNHQDFDEWECFDTKLLCDQYSELKWNEYKDLRYDFLIVTRQEDTVNNISNYTFTVRNTLWNGDFSISKSMSTDPIDGTATATYQEPNKLLVQLTGKDRNNFRVCFRMTQQGEDRTYSNIRIYNTDSYTEQYDDTNIFHKGVVYDTISKKGINGVIVSLQPCDKSGTLLSSGLKENSSQTSNDLYKGEPLAIPTGSSQIAGVYNLQYSSVDNPGTYYVLLTAKHTYKNKYDNTMVTSKTTKIVQVQKTQSKKRIIEWNENDLKDIHKGSIHKYTINVSIENQWLKKDSKFINTLDGQLADITINYKDRDSAHVSSVIKDGKIVFDANYRKYYWDVSSIDILLPESNGYPAVVSSHNVSHVYCKCDKYSDLKYELADSRGADYILLYPQLYDSKGGTLMIRRDQTIAGMTDNTNWTTLEGQNANIIVIEKGRGIDSFVNVNIYGIKFQRGNNAIFQDKYTSLNLKRCYFTGNYNKDYVAQGTCIKQYNKDDNLRTAGNAYTLSLTDCFFYNNYGNCIHSLGNTKVTGCLFKTTYYKCLIQPEPKVINVESGKTTFTNNRVYIKIPKLFPMNHSYAKALTYIGQYGTFNGVGASQLHNDNTLPLYGKYLNQCYTYAQYYYPYDSVKTNIVCSPLPGHEREATGHGSYHVDWIYRDGYQLTRLSNGMGNTHDPWTTNELSIPINYGVYDNTKNEFRPSYDPNELNRTK